MVKEHFLSCDWGTSSFRLKVVDTDSGQVLSGMESTQGIRPTFEAWRKAGKPARIEFYQTILKEAIAQLSEHSGQDLSGTPILLSGMASSSIGMKELPYAALPLPLDGSGVIVEEIPAGDHFPHAIRLISGVRKPADVMRGEEVQAIGWRQGSKTPYPSCLLILPGTHSKHLHIERGKLIDFKTFMTGELYQILQTHSLLSNSIMPANEWNARTQNAFAEGAEAIRRGQLTNLLFSIRARELEGTLDKVEAGYFLSGLLIGSELQEMPDAPVVLGGDAKFRHLYALALKQPGISDPVSILSPEEVDRLVVHGHRALLH